MTLNLVAIVLAFLAVLDPVTGALLHNAGSVFVIVNSSFLPGWAHQEPVGSLRDVPEDSEVTCP